MFVKWSEEGQNDGIPFPECCLFSFSIKVILLKFSKLLEIQIEFV